MLNNGTQWRLANFLEKPLFEALRDAADELPCDLKTWSVFTDGKYGTIKDVGLYVDETWHDLGQWIGVATGDLDFNQPLLPQLKDAMFGTCGLCGVQGTYKVPLSRGVCPMCLGIEYDEIMLRA